MGWRIIDTIIDGLTFGGMAGIGDLMATCMSELSRNHQVGRQLGEGRLQSPPGALLDAEDRPEQQILQDGDIQPSHRIGSIVTMIGTVAIANSGNVFKKRLRSWFRTR